MRPLLSHVVRRGWSLSADKTGKSIPTEGTACAKGFRPGGLFKTRQGPGRPGARGRGCGGGVGWGAGAALNGGQWSATLPITHAVPSAVMPGAAHTLHSVHLAHQGFPLHHRSACAGAIPGLGQLRTHREGSPEEAFLGV